MVLPRELPLLTILTIGGSFVGALLLVNVPIRWLQLAVAMLAVSVFSLVKRDIGMTRDESPVSTIRPILGYVLALALAVYGGSSVADVSRC
jgi:uncharacterized protein